MQNLGYPNKEYTCSLSSEYLGARTSFFCFNIYIKTYIFIYIQLQHKKVQSPDIIYFGMSGSKIKDKMKYNKLKSK